MRVVNKPISPGPDLERNRGLVIQLLKEGLRLNADPARNYLERLDIAEDLLTALGLHEDFHLSIWAEHRRKGAALKSKNNGHVVDKAPTHEKRQKKVHLSRGESY